VALHEAAVLGGVSDDERHSANALPSASQRGSRTREYLNSSHGVRRPTAKNLVRDPFRSRSSSSEEIER
jgi:hypothetical protein